MDKKTQLSFIHRFIPSNKSEARTPTVILFHGTGGNEEDLIPVGQQIAPEAAILSPRGKVLENGMSRFFRRLAEGVFDMDDLKFRTHELADFVEEASKVYGFSHNVIAIGYSNGANIAASVLLLRPAILTSAILFRPMLPLVPEVLPDLSTHHIFISAGLYDPIVPGQETRNLFNLLKKTGAADISINWQNSGHELHLEEIRKARDWLFHKLC
ncbi:MAG TPA: alpha/beta hydrolase [Candidatus Nitrosopolaris sp.]|nr:alpha/beta hydrolase [Candidatus Nitrosopolaris sp.]